MKKKERQQLFLEAFRARAGNIAESCEAAGISRATYYLWRSRGKKFAAECDAILESLVDLAESRLRQLIDDGNFQAVRYFLDRRARHRGYGRHDAHRPLSDPAKMIMTRYRDGELDVVQAATELAILGEPLPEVVRLQLQKTQAPEPVEDDNGWTQEQLDEIYAGYKDKSAGEQAWLEKRRADVAKIKSDMDADVRGTSHASENSEPK